MVDALRQGTLNPSQMEMVRQLRDGIAALADREETIQDVKVQVPRGLSGAKGVFPRDEIRV